MGMTYAQAQEAAAAAEETPATTPTRDGAAGLTSLQWIQRLSRELASRQSSYRKFDAYYRGDQGNRLLNNKKYKAMFVKLFEKYCENFMAVVVDAVEERLDIEGFRFPKPVAPGEDPDTQPTTPVTLTVVMPAPPPAPAAPANGAKPPTNGSAGPPSGASALQLPTTGLPIPPDETDDAADYSIATDPEAWQIWQDNELDAMSQIAHVEALVKSICYVAVSPYEADRIGEEQRSPLITIEAPETMIVHFRPGTRERIVAMKRWEDKDLKRTFVTLYYPDRIEKWEAAWGDRSTLPRPSSYSYVDSNWHVGDGGTAYPIDPGTLDSGKITFSHRAVPGETWPLENPMGVVPIIPLVNRPRLDGSGESEIEKVIPLQDAINTLALNELVTSETAAFPQKWATGIEIPKDPETGKDVEPFQPDISRILSTVVPDAKFGQFEAANLATFGDAIDRRVKRIASITRTPYHYFLDHGGQPPSGESLKSAEVGLVRKARRKTRHFGERWEEVMRLAFLSLDDDRSKITDNEAEWANPESMTESEHIDALTKKRTGLKVPLEQLWEDAGYTPQQRAKFRAMLREEAGWLAGTSVEPINPTTTGIVPDQAQVQERVAP